jgi:hypothetical protein
MSLQVATEQLRDAGCRDVSSRSSPAPARCTNWIPRPSRIWSPRSTNWPPARSATVSKRRGLHAQPVPAATLWTINHNLGFRPAVAILDSGGNEIEADVVHTRPNQLVIHFAIPVAGVARLT